MRLKSWVVMILCMGSAGARAEEDRPNFPSAVELVTVDAVVVDVKGAPVAGLTAADFVIKEDGHEREIESFEAVVVPVSPASPARAEDSSPVASNEVSRPETVRRAVALVVDDLTITVPESRDVRRALTAFIDQSLAAGDLVTYATTSGDAFWSTRFPEGREDLRALVGRFKGRYTPPVSAVDAMADPRRVAGAVGGVTGRVGALAQTPDVVDEQGQRLRAVLETVRRSTAALAGVRGRKSLLLFSRGFVEDPKEHPEGDVRSVVAASREANTAVYSFDVRGLFTGQASAADAGPAPDPRQFLSTMVDTTLNDAEGAQRLAEETGGRSVRNRNDLVEQAVRVGEESRAFYLLGFHPQPGKRPEDWRKLEVEVKREGLTVRARRGYDLRHRLDGPSPSDAHGKDVSPVVLRALDSAVDAPAIPLRAMTYVLEPRPKDKTRVLVAVEIDARRLTFETAGAARLARLEVSVHANHRDSELALRADRRAEVRVTGDQEATWRGITQEFDLPAGVSQIRVAVRDGGSNAVGSITQRIEVPHGKGLHLSTPVVSDQLDRTNKAHPSAVMAVHRVFPARGTLYCQYEVFGAASDKKSPARVSASFTLRAADGRIVRESEASRIAADRNGRLVRLVGVEIGDLQEGAYELTLVVTDDAAGSRVEHNETISLSRGGS